jgi:hypothetical protein
MSVNGTGKYTMRFIKLSQNKQQVNFSSSVNFLNKMTNNTQLNEKTNRLSDRDKAITQFELFRKILTNS